MLGRGQTGNTKLVKQINREGILQQLRIHKRMSRADLAKTTELSRPCVSSIVDELIKEGLVHEVGTGESKGGRRPILLEYNFQAYGVVGVVFEGSMLQMSIANLKGELTSHYRVRLEQPVNGEKAIQALEQGLLALLSQSSFDKSRLLGVGLGLPGITHRRQGTISYAPSTGWMDLPVQKEMEERLGLPVILDNDVNMMTLGEFYKGVGSKVSHLVYMYVGTGIGAGIIIDRQLYRGIREAAGEIGYMMVGSEENRLHGEYGVFERNYSVTGIYEKAKALLPAMIDRDHVIKQLVQLSDQGSKEAGELLENVYRHWAYGIANMVSVLDPELLILSGQMIHIGDKGIQAISALLRAWVPYVPDIRLARLGDKAGIIGAVHSVLEAFPAAHIHRISKREELSL
ncbi:MULTISPECIES: ROK family transcriptional regulator [unclassified Paenibacillus]|uniref:ROK family transcriptional regulator n=1 Tax=unclassified Paenibacillus TaxID=185978 RepID=UPI001AE9C086|nr:putative NBD/HSP70 family sugar kinase [Paenibacillus sp. PvP091]MBP1168179.1 putative NBD/HSP70 family sugar kinase [Paenibacillus sp. PvR098]MBP2439207.1 putative NBD/HSP70 family sugar kinase [Paenibacillus sp. PvP052]